MFAKKNGRFTRRTAIVAAVHALALAAGAGAYVALADDSPLRRAVPMSVAAQATTDLEQAFWSCDYVATTFGVQAAPVAFCGDVTQAFREQKFGGDFEQMLQWWRQNKPAAHAAIESLQLTGGGRR